MMSEHSLGAYKLCLGLMKKHFKSNQCTYFFSSVWFMLTCPSLLFRDASFGNCTYDLTVLHCLQGIKKVSFKSQNRTIYSQAK